jgi:hypothetical protein
VESLRDQWSPHSRRSPGAPGLRRGALLPGSFAADRARQRSQHARVGRGPSAGALSVSRRGHFAPDLVLSLEAAESKTGSPAPEPRPPPGLENAKGMMMLINRENGKGMGLTLFENSDDLKRGDEALNNMNPGGWRPAHVGRVLRGGRPANVKRHSTGRVSACSSEGRAARAN